MGSIFSDSAGMRMLSPARRVSRVAPVKRRRACALVFDESPCAYGGVTESLTAALREAEARATFALYGSTAENYPDRRGRRLRESGRGIRYAHLPDFEADAQGGAAACPELVAEILRSGCAAAAGGYRFIPNGRAFFSKRRAFMTAEESFDDLQRLAELLAAQGAGATAYLPPFGAALIADGRSVYDVCNALGLDCLVPAHSFGAQFYTGEDEKAEAERILRAFQARLNANAAYFDGKVVRLDGGKSPRLKEPVAPLVIRRLLALLKDNGYELTTVDGLLARSPFSDLTAEDEAFAAAKAMLDRGYTVCCRDNAFRPNAAVTREELYAMLVPPNIMRDYMLSRLKKTEPVFPLNRRSEKEFLMSPGSAVSAGMFYGYEVGWPLGHRQAAMTPHSFAVFLDKAAAGKRLDWKPPADGTLLKKDLISALDQLIRAEQAV